MTQKTIVLDFGGVLFDTSANEFFSELFEQEGRSKEELEHFLANVFTKKDRSSSNDGDLRDMIEKKVQEHPEWEKEIRAFGTKEALIKTIRGIIPGMEVLLPEIKEAGYRIVGLTNWHGDTFDFLPEVFPCLLQHFNKIVVSGKVRLRKPDPEIFLRAQQEYGNPNPSDVFFFDDKPANIESAKKAVGWNAFTFKSVETIRRVLALKPKPI